MFLRVYLRAQRTKMFSSICYSKSKKQQFQEKIKVKKRYRNESEQERRSKKKGTHTAPYFYRITKPKNVNNKVCSDIEDVHYWF